MLHGFSEEGLNFTLNIIKIIKIRLFCLAFTYLFKDLTIIFGFFHLKIIVVIDLLCSIGW